MNYTKHYELLIARATRRGQFDGYCEIHHILPRCLGGTDDKENLAILTAEEHYVAHQLLIKIYPNTPKLVHACVFMRRNSQGKAPANKLYGWLKRRNSETVSKRMKGNTINSGRKRTVEENLIRSESVKKFYSENPDYLTDLYKSRPSKKAKSSESYKKTVETRRATNNGQWQSKESYDKMWETRRKNKLSNCETK
jgi:hypothetical protein